MTLRAAPSRSSWEAIDALLDRALDLAPAEQDALLEQTRSSDPALAAEVARLVHAERRLGGFLEEPAARYAGPLLAWIAEREPLEPGTTLGPYEIVRALGRGATAMVYLARDPKHRRSVAVKVLHPDLAAMVGAERFLREIEIAATLQHPHILPLFDSGAVDGLLYYVMPHVEGESLRRNLEARGRLPLDSARRIAREVAGALDYSHRRGVVHRDIKPENILLQDGQAVVADFGIARAIDAAGGDLNAEPTFGTGTPAYMSPEQTRPGTAVDGRTDIYSLGCVVYEMLAGEAPFAGTPDEIKQRQLTEAPSPIQHRAPVSAAVERAVMRALAKNPADRFETAGAFASALDTDRRLDRWSTRRKLSLWTAGVAATAAVVVAGSQLRSREPLVVPVATRIAVLPFQTAAADTGLARLGEDLAATVNVTLDRLGGIATVDQFGTLAQAASVERPRSVGDELALGRRFGAGSVLTGTVARFGDNVRIEATLLRSDRPVPVARAIAVAPPESLTAITDSLTLQLIRQVWLGRASPTPSLAAVTTRSVSALRSFLDGERLMLVGHWREAADAYRDAFVADSTFTLAYARYDEAVTWRRDGHEEDAPDTVVHRHMREGRLRLPERERLLVDARLARETSGATWVRLLEQLTVRYPDYWPGWFLYGDALVHAGLRHGHSWAEARVALRRALASKPDLVSAWEHLGWISVEHDTTAFRQSVDERVKLGYYANGAAGLRTDHFLEGLGRSDGVITPQLRPLADSVAHDLVTAPEERIAGGGAVQTEVGFGFPAAQIDIDRQLLSGATSPVVRAETLRSLALSWAARGAWDSALVNLDRFVAVNGKASAPNHAYSLAVLGVWLGVIPPTEAIRRRPAAYAALSGLPDDARTIKRVCLYWQDGVLAFIRHDAAALAAARQSLVELHDPNGDLNAAILSDFAIALDGRRAEAGRRLAAHEWEAADWPGDDLDRYDMLITRMSAATWLAEAGNREEAVRLLWNADAKGNGKRADTYAVAGLAHLALARLLEAQGDRAGALDGYRQLVRRLDLPMPAQRPLVDEAKKAITRLESQGVS